MQTRDDVPLPGQQPHPSEGTQDPDASRAIAFSVVDDFLAYLQRHALTKVVIAWRDEYGPVALPNHQVSYQHYRDVTVLAYHRGTIVRCIDASTERSEVRERLTAMGVQIEERCRNLNASLPRRAAGPSAPQTP